MTLIKDSEPAETPNEFRALNTMAETTLERVSEPTVDPGELAARIHLAMSVCGLDEPVQDSLTDTIVYHVLKDALVFIAPRVHKTD